jgi:ATP-dependent DNA helicase RecQ
MIRRYAETGGCRRRFLLGYFGDEQGGPCGHCDNCVDGSAFQTGNPSAENVPYELQSTVEHAEWGPGVVMSYEEGTVTVLFESVGYKTLSLDLVEAKGLLQTAR